MKNLFFGMAIFTLLAPLSWAEEAAQKKSEVKNEKKSTASNTTKKEEIKVPSTEKDYITVSIEAGDSVKGKGDGKVGQASKERIETGLVLKDIGAEGRILLFATKEDIIKKNYFTAGYQIRFGTKDYFVGPFKFKGEFGWHGQGDKDPSGNLRIMGGMIFGGLAGVCNTKEDDAKVKVCLESYIQMLGYLEQGGRIDLGTGIRSEFKTGDNKIFMGPRYTYSYVSPGIHSDTYTTGHNATFVIGFDFDVTDKMPNRSKKK